MRTELEPLYEMIDELEIAMMTTRRPDGHLESRAMATQKRAEGADLWFVAAQGSGKLSEIESDPRVGLSYYKDRTREWISVSGLARQSRDRETIRTLYSADWSIWFPDGDDPLAGTPDDPRFVLIGVDVHAASFLRQDKPQPVVLFEIAKSLVSDETPELGETQRIEPAPRAQPGA